jgi:hypothetical protein
VAIASLQDQLLRFSGEESLRDASANELANANAKKTQDLIDAWGRNLLGDSENRWAVWESQVPALFGTLQGWLASISLGKTPEERQKIYEQYQAAIKKQLDAEDAIADKGDGSNYRAWLAARTGGKTWQQTYQAWIDNQNAHGNNGA